MRQTARFNYFSHSQRHALSRSLVIRAQCGQWQNERPHRARRADSARGLAEAIYIEKIAAITFTRALR